MPRSAPLPSSSAEASGHYIRATLRAGGGPAPEDCCGDPAPVGKELGTSQKPTGTLFVGLRAGQRVVNSDAVLPHIHRALSIKYTATRPILGSQLETTSERASRKAGGCCSSTTTRSCSQAGCGDARESWTPIRKAWHRRHQAAVSLHQHDLPHRHRLRSAAASPSTCIRIWMRRCRGQQAARVPGGHGRVPVDRPRRSSMRAAASTKDIATATRTSICA